MEHNLVGWYEIPVIDMERAKKFYDTVFDIDVQIHDLNGLLMGWFPFAEEGSGASGSLIKSDAYEPSEKAGVLIYFSSADVNNELGRVEVAGGKVLQEKTQISPEIGFMGLFLDSEGNRLALHSRQ